MERMTKIGMVGVALIMLAACGKGIPSYDATGTFEATEVIVSAEAAGKQDHTGRNKYQIHFLPEQHRTLLPDCCKRLS